MQFLTKYKDIIKPKQTPFYKFCLHLTEIRLFVRDVLNKFKVCMIATYRPFPFQGLYTSSPLFSIVMRGEFSRRSVKKTVTEGFSDAWRYIVLSVAPRVLL